MSQTHDHRKLRLRIANWYFYTNLSHIKWTWNMKQYRFSHLHIYLSFCSLLQSCIIIDIYWNIQKTLTTYISNHMEMDLYWRADILTRQLFFFMSEKKNRFLLTLLHGHYCMAIIAWLWHHQACDWSTLDDKCWY